MSLAPSNSTRARSSGHAPLSLSRSSAFFDTPPFFFTPSRNVLPLVGMYRGCGCFLLAGGPSLNSLPREAFRLPGILTMAINNAAHVVRPHFWIGGDEPTHFVTSIWTDPTIIKFVPVHHLYNPLWDTRNGAYAPLRMGDRDITVSDCPAVVGFRLNDCFNERTFLWEDTINWGDHEGAGGHRSTMLAALRILFLLGVRRVYLCGVDFRMTRQRQYAFAEDAGEGHVKYNLASFKINARRLRKLRPVFDRVGYKVYNCNPHSALTCFEYRDFAQAIEYERQWVGHPDQERTEGLYDSNYAQKLKRLATQGAPFPPAKPAPTPVARDAAEPGKTLHHDVCA